MHLFNKENIWSNPCSPLHTFNHPDKYKNNNSVNRIISKEKEREEIQRKILQERTSFQLESKNVSSASTRNPAAYKLILHTELILPQEIPKKYNNYKGSFRTGSLPAVPPVHPSILHSRIKFLGSYSTSRLPVILPGRNSILHGSQPTRSPSSDSQAHTQGIHLVSTKFYKKGSSIT